MQQSFPSVLRTKSAQKKPAKHATTSRSKISKQVLVALTKKKNLDAKKETFWRPKKGYSSQKSLLLPLLVICLDMEQFDLLHASVYNKSLITQAVTKQELPEYQAEPNPKEKIDSLKKEINKKLFAKADSLIEIFFVLVSSNATRRLQYWMV